VHRNHNRPRFEDPLQLLPKGLTKLYSMWVGLIYPFASKGRNVQFHFTSQLSRRRASRISLGNSVSLRKDAWLNVATEDPAGGILVEEEHSHASSRKHRVVQFRGHSAEPMEHSHVLRGTTHNCANCRSYGVPCPSGNFRSRRD